MKILILGLGQYPKGSGVSAALYFARMKHDILVVDPYYTKAMDQNVARLKRFKNVKCVLGRHATERVKTMELVVRHQRIRSNEPELRAARTFGIPIESELSVFLRACPCPVVGITGTRGKSTTTTLLHAMLAASKQWRKVWLGGNILISPLTYLHQIKKGDIVVLEMSSFQLEGLGEAGRSPQVALITNLMRDHLNTYSSLEEYFEAKAQIFRHQSENDTVILPATKDFNEYAKEAPGHVVRVGDKERFELQIPGEHNKQNARMAVAAARVLGVKEETIKQTLRTFEGLPFRQQVVAKKSGIIFVNDSTATTPDGTVAALRTQSVNRKAQSKIHLIFGGADKELEFGEVAKALGKRKDVKVYLLTGTAEKKIKKAFKIEQVEFLTVPGLKDAFSKIKNNAKRGDTVLLSPGCASFGLFKNEFERGDKFNALVKKYVG